MSDEPINILTNDLSKFFTNSKSDMYDYLSYRKDAAKKEILYSKKPKTFTAMCISGYNSTGPGLIGKVIDSISYSFGFNTFEKHSIKFRFYGDDEYRNGVLSQDPLDSSLTEEQKKTYISLCRNAVVTEHNLIPEYGDIMVVRQNSEGKYFVEKVVGNINKPTAPQTVLSALSRLLNGDYSLLSGLGNDSGSPLGQGLPNLPLNYDASKIKPIKITKGSASKTDGSFRRDACARTLRKNSKFKDLERKETTYFYKYAENDVIAAMLATKPEFYVAATMWAFMGIEQPNYNFPNNNPGGIQSDGGMFMGTSIADYDYQTCYRDSVQFRGFAGFNTLERAMKVKAVIIREKYAKSKGWLMIDESMSPEKIAFNMCRNYYLGWNPIPKDCLANVEKGLDCKIVDKNGKIKDKLASYRMLKKVFMRRVKQLVNFKIETDAKPAEEFRVVPEDTGGQGPLL